MSLDSKPFDQITHEDILALIPDVAEGRTLDYKAAMPDDGEKSVRNFLKDICALANAVGGWLVYGVDEERDDDNRKTGVPSSVCGVGEVNEDAAILAWQQRINQSIEPRVVGHRIGFINGFEDGAKVMLVYVPRSLLSPHRVTYKGTRDFYVRHDRSNELMDISELRRAFVDLGTVPERLEELRAVRISKILAGDTSANLKGGWSAVVHMIPLSSLHGEALVDVASVDRRNMRILGTWSNTSRLNLDGLLSISSAGDGYDDGYSQLYRTGMIEMVRNEPSMVDNRGNGSDQTAYVASQWYEEGIFEVVGDNLALLAELGVKPPVYIGLSLMGTKGLAMARKSNGHHFGRPLFDRDTVMAPFVFAESMTQEVPRLLKPALDVVWQASGIRKSDFYDDEGNWAK